jgi:hypothetical protein
VSRSTAIPTARRERVRHPVCIGHTPRHHALVRQKGGGASSPPEGDRFRRWRRGALEGKPGTAPVPPLRDDEVVHREEYGQGWTSSRWPPLLAVKAGGDRRYPRRGSSDAGCLRPRLLLQCLLSALACSMSPAFLLTWKLARSCWYGSSLAPVAGQRLRADNTRERGWDSS